ncbi:hypothetical protein [Vibrio splendidus]|uniref:hypothetical protein n=1 Tax=Vibrio splendidus TaxID=29497 RepID=UPI001F52B8CF|nr:hypothetical protein [Vibrio splendidus]MDP2617658.1 hypothetical protein [Vibrio splendidus]
MTSTKQLIDTFQSQLPSCYAERAFSIEAQLRAGALYPNLGVRRSALVRLILGLSWVEGSGLFGVLLLMGFTLKQSQLGKDLSESLNKSARLVIKQGN